MKIVRNSIIPFKGFLAMNVFGFLFCRKEAKIGAVTINHEKIHTAQMKEMLYIFFYVWYLIEWFIKLIFYWNSYWAYKNISFEKEAYQHEGDMQYLNNRKHFSWIKLL